MTSELIIPVENLTADEVGSLISREFPDAVQFTKSTPRRLYLTVNRSSIYKVCAFLKDQLGFDHASCVSGVDRCDRYQVVYHITSYQNKITTEIVVDIPHDNPEIDSVASLWFGANWHEREAYDMYGIVFRGHPNLRRILLPDDYEFFPMRKKCDGGH